MKIRGFLKAAILAFIFSGTNTLHSDSVTSIADVRRDNPDCDTWFRVLGFGPVSDDVIRYGSIDGFRLTQVSSWGVSRYTLLSVPVDSDGRKGGVILIWDRASWKDRDQKIASWQRMIRNLETSESDIAIGTGFSKADLWEKQRYDKTKEIHIIDGGVTFMEWYRKPDQKIIRLRTRTSNIDDTKPLLDLLEKFTELTKSFRE